MKAHAPPAPINGPGIGRSTQHSDAAVPGGACVSLRVCGFPLDEAAPLIDRRCWPSECSEVVQELIDAGCRYVLINI